MTTLRKALRPLTEGEQFILTQVQDIYGPHNSARRFNFDENDAASISVVDDKYTPVILVNLTDLANQFSQGLIKSVDDLRRNWLYCSDTQPPLDPIA